MSRLKYSSIPKNSEFFHPELGEFDSWRHLRPGMVKLCSSSWAPAESTGRIWLLNESGELEQLGAVESRDLAVDPTDQLRVVSVDYEGGLWMSVDGGSTWSSFDAPAQLVEVEWGTRLLAVEEAGTIWAGAPDGLSWEVAATGPIDVETFHIDSENEWWVTSKGGAIARSEDAGSSWQDVYVPPNR